MRNVFGVNEIEEKRSELRKAVKQWKKENPFWEDSDSIQTVKSRVDEGTFENYKTVIPMFCQWEGKTPDEIIKEREIHWRHEDRKKRYYYEDRMEEFKQFLVEHHYGANTIKNYLGKVAGFFSNNRLNLNLPNTFWRRADKTVSELAQAIAPTKRYLDNDEIRLILELASNQQKLAILLGYQCGLLPSDIVSLTWEKLNLDWDDERDFIHVENMREKTGAKHVFVLNPDLFHYLRAHWVDIEKPESGWVFRGYRDSNMTRRNLNQFFKELAVKALGESQGKELVFKDLRDCYNEAILDSGVNEEVKDTLMGHLRESAKSSYSISTATVLREYREKIFPKIAVDGWRLRQKASEADELRIAVEGLRDALTNVEQENSSYKVRVDNLQKKLEITNSRADRNEKMLLEHLQTSADELIAGLKELEEDES